MLFHHVLCCEKYQQRRQYNQAKNKNHIRSGRENRHRGNHRKYIHWAKIQSVRREVYAESFPIVLNLYLWKPSFLLLKPPQ